MATLVLIDHASGNTAVGPAYIADPSWRKSGPTIVIVTPQGEIRLALDWEEALQLKRSLDLDQP